MNHHKSKEEDEGKEYYIKTSDDLKNRESFLIVTILHISVSFIFSKTKHKIRPHFMLCNKNNTSSSMQFNTEL